MASSGSSTVTVAALVAMMVTLSNTLPSNNTNEVAGFQQGFLYLTPDRRLVLPPGSVAVLTPTLSLPMGRDLPVGFGASFTTSLPFRISFDELGLTSESNEWGLIKEKHEAPTRGNLAGGDREVMYKLVEDTLQTLGIDGRACLLRAICEMFEQPLQNYGFLGEVLELFFSPSRASNAQRRLLKYREAEEQGRSVKRCIQYHNACPYSFFTSAPTNGTTLPDSS